MNTASGLALRHQARVDLVGLEHVVAVLAVPVAHRHPGVGDHAIGALDRRLRIVGDDDGGARLFIQASSHFFGRSSAGVATRSWKSKRSAACIQEASTLLPSPDPGDGAAADRAALLLEGHDVGHHLAGMERRVSPLITGTVAWRASSATASWSRVRIMMAST